MLLGRGGSMAIADLQIKEQRKLVAKEKERYLGKLVKLSSTGTKTNAILPGYYIITAVNIYPGNDIRLSLDRPWLHGYKHNEEIRTLSAVFLKHCEVIC
jgi:hypothetical protein